VEKEKKSHAYSKPATSRASRGVHTYFFSKKNVEKEKKVRPAVASKLSSHPRRPHLFFSSKKMWKRKKKVMRTVSQQPLEPPAASTIIFFFGKNVEKGKKSHAYSKPATSRATRGVHIFFFWENKIKA
jgi:hypothetical protein